MTAKHVQVLWIVGLIAVVGAVTAEAQVQDVRIRPGITTHMGQKASDHVTLMAIGGPSDPDCGTYDFVRVLPNGFNTGVFRVPVGQVLVVTDVDWHYTFPPPNNAAQAGRTETLRLSLTNLADPSGSNIPVFASPVTLSSVGEGGKSEHMTSGFIVSSEARICVDVVPAHLGLQELYVRGYLAPDR